MLRMIFVIIIVIAGGLFATLGPFHGLLFYLWNAYFRPEYWVYDPFILNLRLSLILGAYVVIRTALTMPNAQINLRTLLIWAFLAQALMGTLASEDQTRSWLYLDVFARVMVITYVMVVLVTDKGRFRLVLLVMALSLGFEMAKQGWADLYRSPGRSNHNSNPFLGDNNGVALGLLMLMPIFGALVQTSTRAWERNMLRFVGAGVLLRAISTYSRGAFIGAGVLIMLTILRSTRRVRGTLAAVALGAIIWQVMPQEFWDRMDTITVEEGEQREESSGSRLHFWTVAVDMANAKPMTGVGLNAFTSVFDRYNTDRRYAGQERAAHSIWFGVLGDLGYPGLVLFIANLGLAFWSCWRVYRLTKKRPEHRHLTIYANALISAFTVYGVTGSFLSHQYNEMAWHLIGMSTALYLIAMRELKSAKTVPEPARQVA
jgi:probable O-glycosylation ligase (exosortase A-associated)